MNLLGLSFSPSGYASLRGPFVKALRVSFYLKHLDMLFGIPVSSQLSKPPRFSLGVVCFNETS